MCILIICDGNNVKFLQKSEVEHRNDEDTRQRIIERYSSNYTRWSESNYKPDDDATKEEAIKIEEEKENQLLTAFESNNKKWCNKMANDIQQRKVNADKKNKEADKNRMKGNSFFLKKHYSTALSYYFKAFELNPFNATVLTNMAICYGKLNQMKDAIEFCNRACYVDKTHMKAFYNRALFFIEQKSFDKALKDLELCKHLKPESLVVFNKYEWLLEEIRYEDLEDYIKRTIINNDQFQCGKIQGSVDEQSTTDCSSAPLKGNDKNFDKDAIDKLQILSQVKDSEFIDHCNNIDNIMNKIKKYDMEQDADNDTNGSHSFELLGFILIEKLNSQPITKTYLRLAGHLENICNTLFDYQEMHYALRKILYDIISVSVIDEQRSMEVVLKVSSTPYFHYVSIASILISLTIA